MSKIKHVYIEPVDIARRHLQNLLEAGLHFGGKRILDLGCGSGTYSRLMAELGATSVVGIDIVRDNVEIARRINSVENVEFVCGDIEELAIQGDFDLIFIRGTIYYLESSLEEIISRLVNMLPPGGELFITFMGAGTLAILMNTLKKFAATLPGVIQSPFRDSLAAIYYFLVFFVDRSKPNWYVMKSKMNTVFFPLNHLTPPETAKRILEENGLYIAGFFGNQGENPAMSDEYGIWAVLKKRENLPS